MGKLHRASLHVVGWSDVPRHCTRPPCRREEGSARPSLVSAQMVSCRYTRLDHHHPSHFCRRLKTSVHLLPLCVLVQLALPPLLPCMHIHLAVSRVPPVPPLLLCAPSLLPVRSRLPCVHDRLALLAPLPPALLPCVPPRSLLFLASFVGPLRPGNIPRPAAPHQPHAEHPPRPASPPQPPPRAQHALQLRVGWPCAGTANVGDHSLVRPTAGAGGRLSAVLGERRSGDTGRNHWHAKDQRWSKSKGLWWV
jgi:hypothetical protein